MFSNFSDQFSIFKVTCILTLIKDISSWNNNNFILIHKIFINFNNLNTECKYSIFELVNILIWKIWEVDK